MSKPFHPIELIVAIIRENVMKYPNWKHTLTINFILLLANVDISSAIRWSLQKYKKFSHTEKFFQSYKKNIFNLRIINISINAIDSIVHS